MEEDEEITVPLSNALIVAVVILASVIASLISAVYYEILSLGISLQILNFLVSSLLSVALVVLYSQQKDVLESQVELKQAELSGDLYVTDFSFEGKSLEVNLSNLSGSEISDLVLRTEIFPKEIEGKSLGVSRKALQRDDDYETQFGVVAGLAPREQSVAFTGTPAVYYTDEENGEMITALTYFVTLMREDEIEKVSCRMWVEGTDQLGRTVKSKVFPWDRTIRIDTEKPVYDKPELEEVFERSISASIDESESEY